MGRALLLSLAALAAAAAAPAPGAAQDSLAPWEGGFTTSLGQPPRTRWFSGGSFGLDWGRGQDLTPVALGTLGGFKDISNPVTGLLAASFEVFGGFRAAQVEGGARALFVSTVLRLSGGVEYNARSGKLAPFFGLTMPVRRGGIFGAGSLLRAEWTPSPGDAVRATVLVPIGQPHAGRTRPRADEVDVPTRLSISLPRPEAPQALDTALGNVRTAALRIEELVVPHLDVGGGDPERALAPVVTRLRAPPPLSLAGDDGGLNLEYTVRYYHAELTRAFAIAASGLAVAPGETTPQGDSLAASARAALLDYVLFPFDRLLGQRKSDGTLRGLAVHARGAFARALVASAGLAPDRDADVQYVFQELLEAVDSVRARALDAWGDSRVVWIPLQLGLLPEEHDTQGELDRVIERAVGENFTDGNRVWYVINEQFQAEVTKSILDARDYHVLWIHDFRGRNDQGKPDAMSLRYVVDAYLRALTARVRAYDSSRVLPVYMIFLDQHYYEVNKGRIWLDFLEHPLDSLPRLPKGFEEFRQTVSAAQDELRRAVDGSHLLLAEARQYGVAWLANVVKVHVSVTNPADPSFWGHDIMPAIGIPDNLMRDHRKIAFYDITEEDPYRGLAIYTGMGIGEHYAGPTWEDRSIMAQGPAILTLKDQARRLLLSQGLRPDQIPYPLRTFPRLPDYDARVRAEIARRQALGERDQRAMELHNETGYEDKPINVARATLYSLMPKGSVVKVPDSLWGSSLYASLLCGSAFRGVRVLFIAPSLQSAPSSGWPQLGLTHDLFARLIVLQQALGPELEAVGGLIKTGIYNPGLGVQDVLGRFAAAYRNGRRTPFLRRLYPVDPAVDSLLVQMSRMPALSPASGPARYIAPKLHLKATFFASREGWDALVSRPEMTAVLLAYFQQLQRGPDAGDVRTQADALRRASQQLVDAFRAQLTPEQREKVVYYLMVGSANQDYRSMFMDGEASVLMSGWSGVVGLIDFGLLANLSVWVDDLKTLDELLPAPSGVQRAVARWIRPML